MEPYFESLFLPVEPFPARCLITATMEHAMQVHPHWHPEVEILFYMNRCALQQVNDTFFTAEPGDVVIIGRDQLHSTYTIGKSSCSIMVIQFDAGRLLEPITGNQGIPIADFNHETVYDNPIKTTGHKGEQLKQTVEELYAELEEKKPAHQYMVRAAIYRLTGLLSRMGAFHKSSKATAEHMSHIHDMLEKTFRLVDESFAEEISLRDAANSANLSTTHFCRLFRQSTGMTFHEYLTFYRVNRAEKMLDSKKKIAEVAFDCGFGSVSSFLRNFQKYKNCTPSQSMQDRE